MTGRKKQIYLAVLGVGALALAIDRFALQGSSGPASAAAADTIDPATPSLDVAPLLGTETTSAAPRINPADRAIPALPFPRDLPPVHQGGIRDLFAVPTLRVDPALPDKQRELADPSQIENKRAIVTRIRQSTLHAIMSTQGLKIAVVEDRMLKVGDSLDGCRLESIHEYDVVFACEHGEETLTLDPRLRDRAR